MKTKLKIKDIKTDNKVSIKEPDNQGRRVIYIKGKPYGKLSERKYGISWQRYENKKWQTDKIISIEDFEEKVHNILGIKYKRKQKTIEECNKENKISENEATLEVEIKQQKTEIEINENYMIPKEFLYYPRSIEIGITDYEAFEKAMDDNKNVLLIGPTGSGKTTMVRYYCAKYKKPYARVSLNGGATVEDLVGHYILKTNGHGTKTEWIDGILTQAVRYGWIIAIDEINAAPAEILFILNSLLDDERILILSSKDGEIVRPHPDFRVIATCNPTEQGYAGTNEINEALLDRFHRTFYIDYDVSIEKKILKKMGLQNEETNNIIEFTKKVRKSYTEGEIITPFSTRSVMNLAELMRTNQAKLIINRFRSNERLIISDLLDIFIYKTKSIYEKEEVL